MMNEKSSESTVDRPSLTSLLDAHGRELHAHLWRMLGDLQDAEDCLQETYLRALRAFEKTDSSWNYRAWLYKIATNVARSYFKRHQKHHLALEGVPDQQQPDPQDAVLRDEQIRQVLKAMTRLSYRQKTAIMMRKYSGLAYEEIGEVLGCSPETARAHVYQGLKGLRVRLGMEVMAGEKNHG